MDLGSLLTAAILQSCCEMGGSAITSNFKVMGLFNRYNPDCVKGTLQQPKH